MHAVLLYLPLGTCWPSCCWRPVWTRERNWRSRGYRGSRGILSASASRLLVLRNVKQSAADDGTLSFRSALVVVVGDCEVDTSFIRSRHFIVIVCPLSSLLSAVCFFSPFVPALSLLPGPVAYWPCLFLKFSALSLSLYCPISVLLYFSLPRSFFSLPLSVSFPWLQATGWLDVSPLFSAPLSLSLNRTP